MFRQKSVILIFFGIFAFTTIEAVKKKGKEIAESSYDPNKIWRIFTAKDVDNEKEVEYRIQNIPDTQFDTVVDFMMSHYFNTEPIYKGKGIRGGEEHIESWLEDLRANMSVACYNHLNELVGVLILVMEEQKKPSKGEKILEKFKSEKEKSKSKATQETSKQHEFFIDAYNVYKEYEVDRFLTDDGLIVAPLYRDKGIEKELLEVIKPICMAHGIEVYTGIFTSDPMNELADKLGFKIKKQIGLKKKKINAKLMTIRSIKYKH
ncbi:uncharacterized protein LOC116350530 [Contarinia nasturtii]|uniref:uncharacterized protein LOC116350530 n=1 Tax=Contarinia nasturtii TaxID=265458 RepID=UPI0012D39FCB|nr:uncharacterized protein LOC116350530 [Contarinia nasturtii]